LLAFFLFSCTGNNSKSDAGVADGGKKDGNVDDRPDAICKPGTFGFSGQAFVDKTKEANLDEDGIDATAFVMSIADLDSDGYEEITAISQGQKQVDYIRPMPL